MLDEIQEISARLTTHEFMLEVIMANQDDTHHSSVRGLPDFKLDDGRNLTRIDEDTFEIRGTGQRLKRVGGSP